MGGYGSVALAFIIPCPQCKSILKCKIVTWHKFVTGSRTKQRAWQIDYECRIIGQVSPKPHKLVYPRPPSWSTPRIWKSRKEIEGAVLSTAQSFLYGIVKKSLRHPKQKWELELSCLRIGSRQGL
jgi:hypothetical protein